jgi:outer membrane protein
MRMLCSAAIAGFLGWVSLVPALAQSKIAIVDFNRAVVDTAEFKKAYAEIEARYKPRQDALAKAQQELADLETQLRASQGQLSAAGTAELQSRTQRKQMQVERLQEDLQEDFEEDRGAALRLVSNRMTAILQKVADELQVDAIIDASAARFFRPALDATNKVIQTYDAAHPVK